MGYWDHVDISEWLYTSEEEYEYQQQLDEELMAHEYEAGRQLFLDNLPLTWCENADQQQGWLSMLPEEERRQAIRDALAAEPLVVDAADELPF